MATKTQRPSRKPAFAAKQVQKREQKRIGELAQRYLDRHQSDRYRIAVAFDGIEKRGDTWFIVAEPDKVSAPTYDYINRMTEAAMEMEDREKIAVLMVPVLPPEDD